MSLLIPLKTSTVLFEARLKVCCSLSPNKYFNLARTAEHSNIVIVSMFQNQIKITQEIRWLPKPTAYILCQLTYHFLDLPSHYLFHLKTAQRMYRSEFQ